MNILALDTSFSACSVALQHGDTVSSLFKIAPMQHTQLILPMIQELLSASNLKINELDAITYGCGPGSFTGIRIASTVAQGLGFSTQPNIPIIPISSLTAMAHAAFLERKWANLLLAMDAQRGQIYWAVYKPDYIGYIEPIRPEEVYNPQEVKIFDNTDITEWQGIGDGWEKYGEKLIAALGFKPQAINSAQLPTAQAILELAKPKLASGKWVTCSNAMPVYL